MNYSSWLLIEDALTTAASVAVVADELRVPWRLLIAAEAERRHLPRQLGDHAEELTAEQISAIGAIGPSVTVVVRGNHVVDAAAGVLGPSQVASLAVRGYRLEDPIGRAEDAELKAVI